MAEAMENQSKINMTEVVPKLAQMLMAFKVIIQHRKYFVYKLLSQIFDGLVNNINTILLLLSSKKKLYKYTFPVRALK